MSEECRCDDPFGLYVCHVHDCPECSGRAGKHSGRCYLHLRDRLEEARQQVAALVLERDHAEADAAALRAALQKIADADRSREAFVMMGTMAFAAMVRLARVALSSTTAGAALLARLRTTETMNARLAAARELPWCDHCQSGGHSTDEHDADAEAGRSL